MIILKNSIEEPLKQLPHTIIYPHRAHWYVVIVCYPGRFDPSKIKPPQPRKRNTRSRSGRKSMVSVIINGVDLSLYTNPEGGGWSLTMSVCLPHRLYFLYIDPTNKLNGVWNL